MCSDATYSQFCASKAAIEGGAAGAVLSVARVLDASACASLRAALDAEGTSTIDSVDQMRERVLYLELPELERLIGVDHARQLLRLPARYHQLAANAAHAAHAESTAPDFFLFDCFLRRYSSDAAGGDQLLTSFHADTAALTVNVALTSDADIDGGRLLGAYDGAVRTIEREMGDATVHSSDLLHGVTRMHAGTRYSLICFFGVAPRGG